MNTSHSDYPFDLGTHCPAFVVTNDEAAAWFATGLSWLYGFNHEEAIGCFRHAAQADDGFALAWWGIAISSGPFMNKPWEWLTMPEKEQALAACHGAIAEAMSRTANAPPEARALIEALAVRYPQTEVPDDGVLASWERAYADAMIPVMRRMETTRISLRYISIRRSC